MDQIFASAFFCAFDAIHVFPFAYQTAVSTQDYIHWASQTTNGLFLLSLCELYFSNPLCCVCVFLTVGPRQGERGRIIVSWSNLAWDMDMDPKALILC